MTCEEQLVARNFLLGLTSKERHELHNTLLALEHVHQANENHTFYAFRHLKRAAHRHVACRKRTVRYVNETNDELLIHQMHEQHIFKHCYTCQVYFNSEEFNYAFVQQLLAHLASMQTEAQLCS